MAAIDKFNSSLDEILLFRQFADSQADSLRSTLEEAEELFSLAEAELIDAKAMDSTDPSTINTLEATRQTFERDYKDAKKDFELWVRQLFRRTTIASCTAFECFLRDYLVEQLSSMPSLLEKFLRQKVQISVRLDGHIPESEIDRCIAIYCRSFGSVKKDGYVQSLYKDVFTRKPFGVFHHPNSWFPTKQKLTDAYIDIQMLFILRHAFVHRNGSPRREYTNAMVGDATISKKKGIPYQDRLDPMLKGSPPNPDEILISPAVSDPSKTKLEEMVDSLRQYAKYIAEICEVR